MRSFVGVVDQIVGDGGSQPQVLDAGHDRASGTFMRLGNQVSLLAGCDRLAQLLVFVDGPGLTLTRRPLSLWLWRRSIGACIAA